MNKKIISFILMFFCLIFMKCVFADGGVYEDGKKIAIGPQAKNRMIAVNKNPQIDEIKRLTQRALNNDRAAVYALKYKCNENPEFLHAVVLPFTFNLFKSKDIKQVIKAEKFLSNFVKNDCEGKLDSETIIFCINGMNKNIKIKNEEGFFLYFKYAEKVICVPHFDARDEKLYEYVKAKPKEAGLVLYFHLHELANIKSDSYVRSQIIKQIRKISEYCSLEEKKDIVGCFLNIINIPESQFGSGKEAMKVLCELSEKDKCFAGYLAGEILKRENIKNTHGFFMLLAGLMKLDPGSAKYLMPFAMNIFENASDTAKVEIKDVIKDLALANDIFARIISLRLIKWIGADPDFVMQKILFDCLSEILRKKPKVAKDKICPILVDSIAKTKVNEWNYLSPFIIVSDYAVDSVSELIRSKKKACYDIQQIWLLAECILRRIKTYDDYQKGKEVLIKLFGRVVFNFAANQIVQMQVNDGIFGFRENTTENKFAYSNMISLFTAMVHGFQRLNRMYDAETAESIIDKNVRRLKTGGHKIVFGRISDNKYKKVIYSAHRQFKEDAKVYKPIIGPNHDWYQPEFVDEKHVAGVKRGVLDSIADSKGPLSIVFHHHGSKKHLWFVSGRIGIHDMDNMNHPLAISYKELAQALMMRGDLDEVVIVISSCYSYDFSVSLLNELSALYLRNKGITEVCLPGIICFGNKNSSLYGKNKPLAAVCKRIRQVANCNITILKMFFSEAAIFSKAAKRAMRQYEDMIVILPERISKEELKDRYEKAKKKKLDKLPSDVLKIYTPADEAVHVQPQNPINHKPISKI